VPDDPLWLAARRVREVCVAAGLAEARPMPFTRGDSEPRVRVTNPLAEDEPFLRRSVLETLRGRAEHNLNRHQGDVRLFEIGSVFEPGPGASRAGGPAAAPSGTPDAPVLPREELRVAAMVMGARRPTHFTESKPPAWDPWDVKALAEAIARAAHPQRTIVLRPGGDGLRWSVEADGEAIGWAGGVSLDAPVWASPGFGVEVTLGELRSAAPAARGAHAHLPAADRGPAHFARYTPIPVTPAAEFDLALIVPDRLTAAEVERVIRASAGALLERLVLFDEFHGASVPDGTRSLAWRLTLRHPERTLRDKEIDGRRAQLLKTLENELGVVQRTG